MSHVTRVLVTGGSGIMATALAPYFPLAEYRSHGECDVTNPVRVRQVFQEVRPELVIHCAALTAHNAEPHAYVVANIEGTCHVVAQARRCNARLVYLSTDYLAAPREDDAVRPVNPYAASKYAGEIAVRSVPNGLVIRGSWYDRLELDRAATDAFTTKLPVAKAAYYVAILATSAHTGTVNIAGPRRSFYDIALEFNEQVLPVSRHSIRLPYELPADTSLDTTRLAQWLAA